MKATAIRLDLDDLSEKEKSRWGNKVLETFPDLSAEQKSKVTELVSEAYREGLKNGVLDALPQALEEILPILYRKENHDT